MLQMKVSLIGTALAAIAIASAPAHATTVYSTGFESPDYATGQLSGQSGWAGSAEAIVQTSNVDSGLQAVTVDASTGPQETVQAVSYNSVGNTDQVVTISTDFMFSLGGGIYWEVLSAGGNGGFITQLLVNGSTGQVCGFNPCNGPILTSGTWYTMSMQLDYSTDTVEDLVNGVVFSTGPFDDIPALSTNLSSVEFGINSSATNSGAASWDNISVASSVVPEPATWAIMVADLAFLGFNGWKKAANSPLAGGPRSA